MKKGIIACVITSILIGDPFSFHLQQSSGSLQQTSITGKVSPAEAAEFVWILHAKDTLKTPITWGSFSQSVKPGKYKLIINAKAPYKKRFAGKFGSKTKSCTGYRGTDSSEMIVLYIFGIRMQQMNKPLINLSLINLQLFCISLLCIFFVGLYNGAADHSGNPDVLSRIFIGFVIFHFLVNGILLYRFKARYFDVIVIYLEAIVLYGLIAWDFSS